MMTVFSLLFVGMVASFPLIALDKLIASSDSKADRVCYHCLFAGYVALWAGILWLL